MQDWYTVGVKKFIGFKKYLVNHHFFEFSIVDNVSKRPGNIKPWLVLVLTDGSYVFIPEIDQKSWVVYPDYKDFLEYKKALALDTKVSVAEEMPAQEPASQ